jgi:nicotinic acid mononucleotide adenylyltransferase
MATVVVVRRGTGDLPIAYPFVFVSFEGDDSSSTEIRYDVSGNRDSLPEGVFNYIEKKGLYA